MGRPIAPRGASMLEMGKYGNETPGAASGNCSDAIASRQNLRAASVAAGKSWICHRDIVNLETRRRLARRHSRSARMGANATIRSKPRRPPLPGRSILASACSLPARTLAGASKSSKRSDGSTTRTGLFVQPAGHLMMVPAKRLAQPKSEPARRTRSEFVTPRK